jgi:predicted amidophosphoribosyltransferase
VTTAWRRVELRCLGGRLSYRHFVRPHHRGWTTRQWVEWLREQQVAPSVRADESGVCALCRAPTPVGAWGTHYEKCHDCYSKYDDVLDGFVPMCYSVHDGLESLIWRAKNKEQSAWLQIPLAALLWTFTRKHVPCLERTYGGRFDLRLTVPSHPDTRGGVNHLDSIIRRVPRMMDEWQFDLLRKASTRKAGTRRRTVDEEAFAADAVVRGKRVLLLDDTYTSGSTLASAAYALKSRGATSVVGLAFGRQLGSDWDPSRKLIADLESRALDTDTCAEHHSRDCM